MNICQSCSMPMDKDELFGKNKDGSKNEEYCIYCYPDGDFKNPNETFESMVETCVPFLMKQSNMDEEKAREYIITNLKHLKRWAGDSKE